ncbi:MAG: LytTR family DNA-binding domain-containing protein [Pseudomonadota bacterium]
MNLSSPRNLRLGALVLVFIAINQVDDPLVDASLAQELIYWFARNAVLACGLWLADSWVSTVFAQRFLRHAWFKPVILVTAIGSLPLAVTEILMEPHLPMRPEFVDDDLWSLSPLLALFSEYATLLTILVPVHLLLWLVIDNVSSNTAVDDQPESYPRPDFLQRASFSNANKVLALQAEEHYLRIYTASGEELVHCRFGDAVAQMPAGLGLQVHRSWWVAQRAVVSAKRGSRRWQLALEIGVAVPVSDSYIGIVREHGWLKRKRAPQLLA